VTNASSLTLNSSHDHLTPPEEDKEREENKAKAIFVAAVKERKSKITEFEEEIHATIVSLFTAAEHRSERADENARQVDEQEVKSLDLKADEEEERTISQ
jgi:hypothetical protein